MERANVTRVERELRTVNQCIREAEERRGRGDPGAEAKVSRLRGKEFTERRAMRTASDEDYVIDRRRRREKRSTFKKIVDTLTMDR